MISLDPVELGVVDCPTVEYDNPGVLVSECGLLGENVIFHNRSRTTGM